MIRFLHGADIHLGRAIGIHGDIPDHLAEMVQHATYTSFRKIVDRAIELNVDFVLISGDVYDHEQRSLRGQWFVKKQAERLLQKNIFLFIIHGNHDPLLTMALGKEDMPNNVHIYSHEVTSVEVRSKDNDKAYIYGFSYPTKAYYINPTSMYRKVGDKEAYHIAMLHGQERSQKDHEPYAPFTVKELLEKEFDYWALGHIHKRQTLSSNPPIVYPGNIQGANRKETGEKGVYLVEMTKGETTLTFLPTNPIQWEKVSVSIDEMESFDKLLERIEEELVFPDMSKIILLDLTIEGSGPLHELLLDESKRDELLTLLREEILDGNYLWVDRLHVNTLPAIDRNFLKKQDHILGDVVRIVDELKEKFPAEEVLNQVYGHASIKKYLTSLTESELLETLDEAEIRLLTPLIRELEKK